MRTPKIVLSAAAAAFVSLAAAPAAHAAGGCNKWYCGENGTQLDGLRQQGAPLTGIELRDVRISGLPQNVEAQPAAVAPRADETVDPR